MPATMPSAAPRPLARRQISPPTNAGANCAIAANDLRPIEDSRAPFVRGNHAGGEAAAERALTLLTRIRAAALGAT